MPTQKTSACKNGHQFPENAYVRPDNGHRFCKQCVVEAKQRRRREQGVPRLGERGKLNVPRGPVPENTAEVGYIPLTQGKYATVDIADYAMLMQWNWQAACNRSIWYAVRTVDTNVLGMHSFLLGTKKVDHQDHDGLNNRRSNLRPATSAQNSRNAKLRRDSTTGFKGVTVDRGKSRSRITVDGSTISLGYYSEPEMAARAYDEAAKNLHGEFACHELLNIPPLRQSLVEVRQLPSLSTRSRPSKARSRHPARSRFVDRKYTTSGPSTPSTAPRGRCPRIGPSSTSWPSAFWEMRRPS
jgi:hypothetical protein